MHNIDELGEPLLDTWRENDWARIGHELPPTYLEKEHFPLWESIWTWWA